LKVRGCFDKNARLRALTSKHHSSCDATLHLALADRDINNQTHYGLLITISSIGAGTVFSPEV
jgi:hypothetical protein